MWNFDYRSGGGLSWVQWEDLMAERMKRAHMPSLPESVSRPIWNSMAEWIALNLFVGTNAPWLQFAYWLAHQKRQGMYGGGSPDSGQPDYIINAWEILGGGDWVKGQAEADPLNAPVLSKAGPPFLGSMWHIGPVVNVGSGEVSVAAHTKATMTPYDPTAGGTRPIMYYLRRGWKGQRAMMRPRWPDGAAPFVRRAKPYAPHMSRVTRYLLKGD